MNQLALTFPDGDKITEGDVEIFSGGLWKFGAGTGAGGQLLPADILNALIPVIFIIAGLILLFLLVFGGFTIFVSGGNPEKIKKGQGMIVSGLVGFLIIFAAYWIIELLQITLGIKVL